MSETARDPQGQVSSNVADATAVDHAPKLDGTLDDPLWQSAEPITDFRQREPHEGRQPTERTEVRILYNYRPDSDLYIIYNVGTQFASLAPANPPQVRETRFAVKYTYSWRP